MALTIYDVAKEAGYSHTAVSATLNGRGDKAGIGQVAQRKIIEVASRLGYRRNALASALFGGENRVLGVMISEPDKQWVGQIVRGALAAASDRDYLLKIVSSADTPRPVDGILDVFLEQRISGVFLADFEPGYKIPELVASDAGRRRLRLVNCNSDLLIPGRHINPDDEDGTRQAVHHLVELGHQRIGYIGPRPVGEGRATVRWRGYHATMTQHGLEASEELEHFVGWVPNRGDSIKAEWLANGAKRMPTAVLCANDQIAARVIRQCRRSGLEVPADVSVIGFSDELLGRYVDPPLTSINQRFVDVGRRAINLLIDELEADVALLAEAARDGEAGAKKKPKPRDVTRDVSEQILMPVRLIVRESTAAPRS
ncbi:MAG: LacI family DNA-binding transcriptional regulator [Planctomycetota bacterium]